MGEVFAERKSGGAQMLYISALDDNFPVRTFFTCKNGGNSSGVYASLNMGVMSGDDPAVVASNRDLVFRSAGCSIRAVVYPTQVHGSDIVCIDNNMLDEYFEPDKGKSEYEISDINGKSCKSGSAGSEFMTLKFPDTDATVTNVPGVLLTSLHADCIPVWLYDCKKAVAGLAHAGWRGTRVDIAAKTMALMTEKFGCDTADIIAVIGPGISRCCFEVGSEVYESFRDMIGNDVDEFSDDDGNGKFHMDLKGINRRLLERAGAGRIYVSDLCTSCRDDLFYSYRRDGGATGRMCAGICII